MNRRILTVLGLATFLFATTQAVYAQPKESAKAEALPAAETWDDPAFNRYVDLDLLAQAWADLDAATMTDVALQLAEGERILHRPHKALTSEALFGIALKLASDKGDKQTLERLSKALASHQTLAPRAAMAMKLAGQTRSIDPALNVSVETTTPEAFALFRDYLLDIKASRVAGDRAALEQILSEVDTLEGLQAQQLEHLKKEAQAALVSLPKDATSANPLAKKLDALSGEARSLWEGPGGFNFKVRPPQFPRPVPGGNPWGVNRPQTYTPGTLGVGGNQGTTYIPPYRPGSVPASGGGTIRPATPGTLAIEGLSLTGSRYQRRPVTHSSPSSIRR